MRVLVAGAGYVGAELARLLARTGHDVLALRRSRPGDARAEAHANGGSLRWLACDLADVRATRALACEGVEALAYLVAADGRDDDAYRRAYVEGIANLLSRLRAASALRRVLFASSTSVYAQDDGRWLDEDSEAAPRDFSGRGVLAGEVVARGAGVPAVALRLGGIYGPGRASLIAQVRAGSATLPSAPHYTNRVHRDDAARACAHLLALEAPDAIYLGVDDHPADRAEVLRWLATRLAAPLANAVPDPNAAPTGKRCRNTRLKRTGFTLLYPTYREGYESLIAER